ncbi:hypothetical protein AWV80_27170 [Cupriavidus sp. UYMU48A]|nr:hypothetical protein AWV80_27170 [Cupriavidus sp. UYMU48A]
MWRKNEKSDPRVAFCALLVPGFLLERLEHAFGDAVHVADAGNLAVLGGATLAEGSPLVAQSE